MTEERATARIERAATGFARLKALEDAWHSENPPQGGRHALNGFRFQLLCTLDRLVAQIPYLEKSLTAESVADFVEADDAMVVATEVKVSLTHGSLKKALDQLWRVYALSRGACPDLMPHLRYRIVYYRECMIDEKAALARWIPAGSEPGELESFRRNVRIDRQGSVLNGIAARLVNDFHETEPFERIDAWLGALVQASENGSFLAACETIRVDARGRWNRARQAPCDFYVWTAHDRPPRTVLREPTETKQVLTGQRAHVWHLREGKFSNRARYQTMHVETETWLSTLDRSHWDHFQSMWIAGRSGSGKSVALLHLLSELYAFDPQRTILWLGHQANNLEVAVKWALPMMEAGLEVFIGADDPYQSGAGQSVAELISSSLRLIQNRIQTVPGLRMPVFFFCGPPEQQEAFHQETIEDLRTAPYHLGIESPHEIAELRKWYFERTGKVELPTDDEGVLLVQLFFEWQMGEPLDSFAARLKERLKRMMDGRESRGSIFDLVARILAMRRLYVPYPIAALDREFAGNPALKSAFSTLAVQDKHFEIEDERGEIRFTHPHLADAIYRAWFGSPALGPYRADHLTSGLQAWWTSASDPATRLRALWAMEGLLAAKEQPGGQVLVPRWQLIADIAKESLERVFEEQISEIDEPCAYLPVWTRLEKRLGLELNPPALVKLAAAVEDHAKRKTIETRGLPLACRTLVQLAPSALSPMLPPIQDLLNRRPDWKYWPSVASAHGQRFGYDAIYEGTHAFIERRTSEAYNVVNHMLFRRDGRTSELERRLTILWLHLDAAHEQRRLWFHARLISEYLDVFHIDSDIRPQIDTFLSDCLDHTSWSFIWEKMWKLEPESRPPLAEQGIDWLRRAQSHSMGWEFVFERLVEDQCSHAVPARRLLAVARSWLWNHTDLDSWGRVWCTLWSRVGESSRRRMRILALDWLARLERKGWSHVWKVLWLDSQDDAEVLELTRHFLHHGMAHEGWGHVWEQLRQSPDEDVESSDALGLAFLDADVSHHAWAYVWRVLWGEKDRNLARLRDLAVRFLEACVDDDKWSGVFQRVSSDAGEKSEFVWMIGLAWLRKEEADSSLWAYNWKHAWQGFAADQTRQSELAHIGLTWLEERADSGSWPIIWIILWEWPASDRVQLETLAEPLLAKIPSRLFNAVVARLEAAKDRATPRPPTDYHWSDDWRERWQTADSEAERTVLASEALGRLEGLDSSVGGWSKIWVTLWHWGRSGLGRQLSGLAVTWLKATGKSHPRWPALWCLVWDYEDLLAREDIENLGRRFLAEGPLGRGHVQVLKRLFVYGAANGELSSLILVRRSAAADTKL